MLPRSWQWLEGATQMVSAAGRGSSTSQSRCAQLIQKQKQYLPRVQKYNLTDDQVWLELPSLPEGRAAHACFATKVQFYLGSIYLLKNRKWRLWACFKILETPQNLLLVAGGFASSSPCARCVCDPSDSSRCLHVKNFKDK